MAVFDLFSRRQSQKPASDVFVYDEVPAQFRGQFVHMLRAWESRTSPLDFGSDYMFNVARLLCREYGVATLAGLDRLDQDLVAFVMTDKDALRVLDAVEVATLFVLDKARRERSYRDSANEFVEEVNQRFRLHSLGYDFNGRNLVRIDSTFIHEDAVKPALFLLADAAYANADAEFRDAHKHYREGDYDDCLVGCGRALESVLKIICTAKGWPYDASATARPLIQVIVQNNLVPVSQQEQLNQLSGLLATTVPTPRNKQGGHGKGPDGVPADEKVARYLLHQTAATILFLIDCAK